MNKYSLKVKSKMESVKSKMESVRADVFHCHNFLCCNFAKAVSTAARKMSANVCMHAEVLVCACVCVCVEGTQLIFLG